MKAGKLFLIPCPIADGSLERSLPSFNKEVIEQIDYFIVENTRTARRFLSSLKIERPIAELEFVELNEHTSSTEIEKIMQPVVEGRNAGVISEAGVPAVADPGSDAVAYAHKAGIEVIPLVGPSSIILAMMSSGLNGQSFAFNGYLPIKQPERRNTIKRLEQRAITEHQPQMFIETPYRNTKMLEELCSTCRSQTLITVAADLMGENQFIRTATAQEWKKINCDIHKRPTIFIIG